MNKTLKIIIVISFFIVLVFGFFSLSYWGKNDTGSELFTLKDTSGISKIIITQFDKKIIISKANNTWTVNNKYPANKKAIKKLFQTLSESKINKPVLKKQEDSVISEIKSKGKSVSIYNTDNKLIKKLLMGSYVKKQGTYMLNPAAPNPFIVNIPGVENDLNYRYNSKMIYWLNPEIFSYKPNDIKEITVLYPDSLKHSFKLTIFPDTAKLLDLSANLPVNDIRLKKAGSYLSYFMNVKFSSETSDTDSLKNELLKQKIFAEIDVEDIHGIHKNVKLYQIKNRDDNNNFDLNYLYAIINNEDVVKVKYIDFDLILKDIKYFLN